MVINTTLTIQLDNVHALVPLNRTRSQSVPNRSHKHRKQSSIRQKFIPDKPPFMNYASAYINPYRYFKPMIINHDHHRRRFKTNKYLKRKQNKKVDSLDEVITKDNSLSIQILQNTNPIDLWPSNSNSFDMDFIRKRQIAIDNTSYRETINAWKSSSLNNLVTLIKELIIDKDIIDHIWIIYYWISQNIQYDIDSENNIQTSDEIFRLGKTTCNGYATIFQTLCNNIDIKCIKISGYVKDFYYKINQPIISHINHTWNAVQLNNNHWYLIDSTWGSGYINNKHEYKKSLQTYYFLIRPEHMIYNHLPNDSQWQLLAKPISMFDYFRLPYVHVYYFLYELTLISPHFSSMVNFDKTKSLAEILIQAPDDIQLICSTKENTKSTCLTQYDSNRQIWQCLFAPYKSGFYTLIIFANRLSASNSLTNAIELGVEVFPTDFIKRKILPVTFGKFIEYKCQIFSPFDGILKRGTHVTIHCRIPNASCARISVDGMWLEEKLIKDNIFKQEITVPEQEIIIYARFINKKIPNNYDGIIRYLVEK